MQLFSRRDLQTGAARSTRNGFQSAIIPLQGSVFVLSASPQPNFVIEKRLHRQMYGKSLYFLGWGIRVVRFVPGPHNMGLPNKRTVPQPRVSHSKPI